MHPPPTLPIFLNPVMQNMYIFSSVASTLLNNCPWSAGLHDLCNSTCQLNMAPLLTWTGVKEGLIAKGVYITFLVNCFPIIKETNILHADLLHVNILLFAINPIMATALPINVSNGLEFGTLSVNVDMPVA